MVSAYEDRLTVSQMFFMPNTGEPRQTHEQRREAYLKYLAARCMCNKLYTRKIAVHNDSSADIPKVLPMNEILAAANGIKQPFFKFSKAVQYTVCVHPGISIDFQEPGFMTNLECYETRKIKKQLKKRLFSEMGRQISAY